MLQIQKISSRDNQKLKFARSVRDGHDDKRIFLEGLRLCEESIRSGVNIVFVFVTRSFLEQERSEKLIESLSAKTKEIFEIDPKLFDSLSATKNSQGIVLIADTPETGCALVERNLSPVPFLLLLHQINNPSNLGAIIRTAEAVGVDGIITTRGTANVFNVKANRAAMGANLRIPFWVNSDYSEVIRWSRINGISTVCADINSGQNYLTVNWRIPRLLIVGSEGHGLTTQEQQMADESLVIPMLNNVESLNVAVASGVILFTAKMQREESDFLPVSK